MEESMIILGVLLAVALFFGLPIWALIRTLRIGHLERRIEGLEAALLRVLREMEALRGGAPITAPAPAPEPVLLEERPPEPTAAAPLEAQEPVPEPPPPAYTPPPAGPKLEEMIGRNWLGWIGVSVILFGAAFFLKYAFDNRWIGELGRISIGLMAGVGMVWLGWQRHQVGWKVLSQMLTGGGVTLLYLSTYASYGFYDLLNSTAAFAFLALLIVQAHLLAMAYRSPAIALMAQIGGFLVPILLSTGHDRYGVLFSYIFALNVGVLLVALMRQWAWVGVVSYALTHLMFWGWHAENYHHEKLWPAVAFQTAVFALFLAADLVPQMRGRKPGFEQFARLFINPFVFFGTAYVLLDPDYPHWMGAFALLMATLFAGLARLGLALKKADRRTLLMSIGVSLSFVAIAIPIQLDSNWITIGWAAQGAIIIWLANRMGSAPMRGIAGVLLALAVFRQLATDTPWDYRVAFTPVVNRFFLSALAVSLVLGAAAWLFQKGRLAAGRSGAAIVTGIAALAIFWVTFSVETYTYFDTAADYTSGYVNYEENRRLDLLGQMVLSVLWSLYAAALLAAGFRAKMAPLRWCGLGLFLVTVLKVFFVDIAQLDQFYRIIAFLALGLLLLGAAWAYNRINKVERPVGEE